MHCSNMHSWEGDDVEAILRDKFSRGIWKMKCPCSSLLALGLWYLFFLRSCNIFDFFPTNIWGRAANVYVLSEFDRFAILIRDDID